MAELIKALVNVKEIFALAAVMVFAALFAFRTKKVPELFFALLKEKLTRESFSHLLNRFLLLGFIAFALLCGVTIVGYVMANRTQPQAPSIEEFKAEIQKLKGSEAEMKRATEAFEKGIQHLEKQELKQAIQFIAISDVQTATSTAQFTLAYLYGQEGNDGRAREYAAKARVLAEKRGDAVNLVKIDRLVARLDRPVEKERPGEGMIGGEKELPPGGTTFNDAKPISPGLYKTSRRVEKKVYFRLNLNTHQTLEITFRTPDVDYPYANVSIYDKDGGLLKHGGIIGSRSRKTTTAWKATEKAVHYISLDSTHPDTVYRITITD
ncbi:MAG: hypothetical protein HYU47_07450 [Deltaproteobacteria bacterium]|nr:hypothetical protein [Deltaproteobacteria bacterium]